MTHPRIVFPHTGSFEGPNGRTLTAEEVQHLLSGQVRATQLGPSAFTAAVAGSDN
jgi:hypothetical protein